MIKIALIGAGRMGNSHADALSKMPDCKLAGVYDPAPEAAKKFAGKHPGCKIYASEAGLAEDPGLDAVLVCNYSDQHHKTLCALLAAGKKKIFCEKALVRTLDECADILARAGKAGAQIYVGHHKRCAPAYQIMREKIISGELGAIRMAKLAFCHPGYARERGSFFADFERSGGVILDMMSHYYDLLSWFFGEPESVSARSLMFDKSMPLPADYVSGTLTYKNGVICNIDCSWQRHGLAYDRLEVYGDSACVIFDGKLWVCRKNEKTEISAGESAPVMSAFVKMVIDGVPPLVSLQDGASSVTVALKTIEAAKSKKTVFF
jgi:predicted dehydrogenase